MPKNFYGQDCPKGMVQIEFVGVDPNLKVNEYSWKPSKSAFLEVFVDGERFRIDVGDVQKSDGTVRRGLHVCGPIDMDVDNHSINAFDATIKL